jgi:epoxide hydrolase 4
MNVPHPAIMRAFLHRSPAQWRRSWYMLFFQLPWLPEAMLRARGARVIGQMFRGMALDQSRFSDDVLDHFRHNALQPGALTAMINYYRANFLYFGRNQPTPRIDVPTLMIWGEHDAAAGIEMTEGYERYVADFTLRRLPNVSHWVQQEAPEWVNKLTSAWLEQRGLRLSHGT